MRDKEKSVMTTHCYLEKDGKYLMLHRISKKNDVNKDKLSLIHISSEDSRNQQYISGNPFFCCKMGHSSAQSAVP